MAIAEERYPKRERREIKRKDYMSHKEYKRKYNDREGRSSSMESGEIREVRRCEGESKREERGREKRGRSRSRSRERERERKER